MKIHNICVDIYASWGVAHPRYRIYVDQDLLTERDFIWAGHEIYIRENIVVELPEGKHSLKIEHVNQQGKIEAKNITVDGVASSCEFVTSR